MGHVLVAWTSCGICEVALGDDATELTTSLEAHFPKATIEQSAAPAWMGSILDAVDLGSTVDLPLDIRGTAFQERVWQALRAIPRGETRTYTDVARALGMPTGTRRFAVGRIARPNHPSPIRIRGPPRTAATTSKHSTAAVRW